MLGSPFQFWYICFRSGSMLSKIGLLVQFEWMNLLGTKTNNRNLPNRLSLDPLPDRKQLLWNPTYSIALKVTITTQLCHIRIDVVRFARNMDRWILESCLIMESCPYYDLMLSDSCLVFHLFVASLTFGFIRTRWVSFNRAARCSPCSR